MRSGQVLFGLTLVLGVLYAAFAGVTDGALAVAWGVLSLCAFAIAYAMARHID